jgi:Rrf2 family protein
MLLTKASEYALLSIIMIAQKDSPQDVETLSIQLGISKSFLAKILQGLAKEGILNSFKGAHGGFMLAPESRNITIKRIIESAEKRPTSVFECAPSPECCPSKNAQFCKIWPIFNKLQTKIDDFLDSMTLEDVLKR